MNQWRIEQQGTSEWCVRRANERHYAQTAEDAVALMRALLKQEAE